MSTPPHLIQKTVFAARTRCRMAHHAKKALLALVGVAALAASGTASALAVIADASNVYPAVLAREAVSASRNIPIYGVGNGFNMRFNLGAALASNAANHAGRIDCTNLSFNAANARKVTIGGTAGNTGTLIGGTPVVTGAGRTPRVFH